MNKKYLKLSIQIIFILLVLALALYLVSKRTGNWLFKSNSEKNNTKTASTTVEIMTDQEKDILGLYHLGVYEVYTRNEIGRPTSFKLVGVKEATPIGLDFMTNEEKFKRRLATSTQVQVLRRDNSGRIIDYRIMKGDSDVVSAY